MAGTTTMENRSRSRSAMVTLTPSTAMGDLADQLRDQPVGRADPDPQAAVFGVDPGHLPDCVDVALDEVPVQRVPDRQRQFEVDVDHLSSIESKVERRRVSAAIVAANTPPVTLLDGEPDSAHADGPAGLDGGGGLRRAHPDLRAVEALDQAKLANVPSEHLGQPLSITTLATQRH